VRRNPLLFIAALVIVGLAAAYGFHLYRNYGIILAELNAKSAKTVRPFVDEESVSEIGYVYDVRRETQLKEGRLNLVWFVAIPSQDTRWSCSYEAGFADFKIGDGVTIVHKKDDDPASGDLHRISGWAPQSRARNGNRSVGC
jgi:hypothetical protein